MIDYVLTWFVPEQAIMKVHPRQAYSILSFRVASQAGSVAA